MNSTSTTSYQFDQFSTMDTLLNHLKPLMYGEQAINSQTIKKTSHLLIDSFIFWYRSLSFSSLLDKNLNQYILNHRWSQYLLFVISYFLSHHSTHLNSLSSEHKRQRLLDYQQENVLSSISHQRFEQFCNILLHMTQLQLTSSEFSLLSILIVIRTGKNENDR
jgi:hypothetical protein